MKMIDYQSEITNCDARSQSLIKIIEIYTYFHEIEKSVTFTETICLFEKQYTL